MVTNQDVAKLANVSVATVSRAFKDNGKISPEAKAKVLDAAKRLGYYPAFSAQALKHQKSKIIGLILPNYHNDFYTSLTEILEKRFRELGYRLMIGFTEERPELERYHLESFISSRVDAIFITSNSSRENENLIKKLRDYNICTIQILRPIYPFLDSVMIDDEHGAYESVSHLIANGHKKIMYIDFADSKYESIKYKGYCRAFAEAGLEVDSGYVCSLPLCIDHASSLPYLIAAKKPTAIFSTNCELNIAALSACQKLGLRIPDDISLVAYDDNDWLELMGIDTVAHPIDDIAYKLSSLMINMLSDSDMTAHTPETSVIRPYFYMRHSTKDISK